MRDESAELTPVGRFQARSPNYFRMVNDSKVVGNVLTNGNSSGSIPRAKRVHGGLTEA